MERILSLEHLKRGEVPAVQSKKAANARELRAAKAVLRAALEQELTARQRECVQLYFFDGLTQEEIGSRLGVARSTVCRHLQKAKDRLQKAVSYAGTAWQAAPLEE